MNINEQKTALCYFLQIQDSDIFYLKIWIRDKNSLFAPLLTGQYFCCWFSPHPYFMFLLCLLPHSGSILDSQLSWESGKFQLARWSHEVVWFSTWVPPTHPPTHPPTTTRSKFDNKHFIFCHTWAPSWILSSAENLACSNLQYGARKWEYFLKESPTWPYKFFLLNILHCETWISSVELQTQLVSIFFCLLSKKGLFSSSCSCLLLITCATLSTSDRNLLLFASCSFHKDMTTILNFGSHYPIWWLAAELRRGVCKQNN